MKLIEKIIVGATALASMYMPIKGVSQEVKDYLPQIEVGVGFASLEGALTDGESERLRLVENLTFSVGPAELGYSSLHETDGNWYFSRNVPSLGIKGKGTSLCAVVKADKRGVFDTKLGVRNTSLPGKIADYGWMTLSGNKKAGELVFFLGEDLGKGFSGEVFNATNVGYKEDFSNYTEIQINKQITKHINGFGRVELGISDKAPSTVYLLGISMHK